MWSEELIKPEFMWGQIFPRLAAVAERAYKKVYSFRYEITKLLKGILGIYLLWIIVGCC